MYVIHLDWEDFVDQAVESCSTVYIQPLSETKKHMGALLGHNHQIIISFADDDLIHAIRIPVEFADDSWGNNLQDEGPAARRDHAASIIESALWQADLKTRRGMLLETGLREELAHTECAHRLWLWEGNLKDPRDRRLVATGGCGDG